MKTGYKMPEAKTVNTIQVMGPDGNAIEMGLMIDQDGHMFGVDKALLTKDSRCINPYTKVKTVCK